MMTHLLAVALVFGLEALASAEPCDVSSYGLVSDGITDNRFALQAAIYACTDLKIPAGYYAVRHLPLVDFNLHVPAGHKVSGLSRNDTTLIQAPGQSGSTYLLYVDGPDAVVSDIALDGLKSEQEDDEHRAGVFATHAPRLQIRRVTSRNFSGDGFYVHIGSDDVVFDDVEATDNGRNGLSFGGGTVGGLITGSHFGRNKAQQIDSEPGHDFTVDRVIVVNNVIDGTGSNDYALTISGSLHTTRSSGWMVSRNIIVGAILSVWSDGVIISHNSIVNETTKSCISVYRRSIGVTIVGNTCEQSQGIVDGLAGIYVGGTGSISMPEGIVIAGNVVRVKNVAKSFGVRAEGVTSICISDNEFYGPELYERTYAGVFVRSTILGTPLRSAVVVNNTIAGWSDGFRVAGNSGARVEHLEFSKNLLSANARAVVIDSDAIPASRSMVGNICSNVSCAGANL